MPVFEAIANHDILAARHFLQSGGDPNVRNDMGGTPLHVAIYENETGFLLIFLEAGANPNIIDDFGNTPLHLACIFGNKLAAEWLIEYGAEIDSATETRPWTPLMLAINESFHDIADWLISWGANLNYVDMEQGWTPLLVACDQGMSDMILRLIERGVPVDATLKAGDGRGRSAIHLVSYFGKVDLVKVLIQQGADVNQEPEGGGLSALHWAVYNHHMDLVRFLLGNGADPNIQAAGIYQQRTPLHYAVSGRELVMAHFLLEEGANPHLRDNEGRSALDLAKAAFAEAQTRRYGDMVALLESY